MACPRNFSPFKNNSKKSHKAESRAKLGSSPTFTMSWTNWKKWSSVRDSVGWAPSARSKQWWSKSNKSSLLKSPTSPRSGRGTTNQYWSWSSWHVRRCKRSAKSDAFWHHYIHINSLVWSKSISRSSHDSSHYKPTMNHCLILHSPTVPWNCRSQGTNYPMLKIIIPLPSTASSLIERPRMISSSRSRSLWLITA